MNITLNAISRNEYKVLLDGIDFGSALCFDDKDGVSVSGNWISAMKTFNEITEAVRYAFDNNLALLVRVQRPLG